MFTGLVQALAEVCEIAEAGAGRELVIACGDWAADLAIGESVAINGCCLTVVGSAPPSPCPLPPEGGIGDASLQSVRGARFQVGPETLAKTNLGQLQVHDRVNVE